MHEKARNNGSLHSFETILAPTFKLAIWATTMIYSIWVNICIETLQKEFPQAFSFQMAILPDIVTHSRFVLCNVCIVMIKCSTGGVPILVCSSCLLKIFTTAMWWLYMNDTSYSRNVNSNPHHNCGKYVPHFIYLFIYRFVQCTGERTIGHVFPYLVHPPKDG